MAHYDDDLTLRDARRIYFDANGFGADGGYHDAWVRFDLGPLPVAFPNTPSRVRAVRFHDLHHIATGYETTTVGEGEIAAWELGGGCADHYAAVRCALDGPPLLGDSASAALPSVAFDRRGALYLVDADQHVRRYTRARGRGCSFSIDAGFGTAGVLTLPSPVSQVSVDGRGVAVASGVLGSFVIDDGEVTTRCNRGSHGYVTMPARGPGVGIFPGSPVRRIAYEDGSCTVTPWAYAPAFRSVMAVGFDRKDMLLAGSMPDGSNQVAIFDERGRERARFGGARATADDGFCWVHGLSACRAGVCVIDTNCDRIRLWSARGEHVGNARASELLGVTGPWLSDIEPGRRGETFIAAGARRSPAGEGVAEGMLFLVSGM